MEKTYFNDKLKILNKKNSLNKTKHVLIQNELKKEKTIKTFCSSFLIGQSYFGNDGSQNFLIFQPINKTLTTFAGLPDKMAKWESERLSNEKVRPPFAANHSLSLKLAWMNNSRITVEFKGSCLNKTK